MTLDSNRCKQQLHWCVETYNHEGDILVTSMYEKTSCISKLDYKATDRDIMASEPKQKAQWLETRSPSATYSVVCFY